VGTGFCNYLEANTKIKAIASDKCHDRCVTFIMSYCSASIKVEAGNYGKIVASRQSASFRVGEIPSS
jgi:hypothetical protein